MATTVSFKGANNLQNATQRVVKQNINLQNAIDALKHITHEPIAPISNGIYNFGITDEDREKISEFYQWLEGKEIPMRELFETVIMNEVNNGN